MHFRNLNIVWYIEIKIDNDFDQSYHGLIRFYGFSI